MGAGTTAFLVALAIVIAFVFYFIINGLPNSLPTIFTTTENLSYPTTIVSQTTIPQNQTIAYALSLINTDRNTFDLKNVSLSNETSGQQHSDSMLFNGYFSHWDVYGMKPYMRYTLLGGRGAVSENIAYIYRSNGIGVLTSLAQMEHNLVYNDLQCCNNGHRYNILDPAHTTVSIGVAYNSTTIYLTQDFINNYISWFYGTPLDSNNNVMLKGSVPSGYSLSDIEVTYDPPLQSLTPAQLARAPYNSSYGYGQAIAGVGYMIGGRRYYYPNLTTINASTYTIQGNNFDVAFNIGSLVQQYGEGEYTLLVFINNATQRSCSTYSSGGTYCTNFIASTYTIFINNNGQEYTPSNI